LAGEWVRKNREKKRTHNNEYHKKNSGNRAVKTASYRSAHPDRRIAHQAVQTAIRNGTLAKKPCAICRSEKSNAHHEDYAKPLEVIWYCHQHHMARHAMIAARGAK
jgi:hypothetical protein